MFPAHTSATELPGPTGTGTTASMAGGSPIRFSPGLHRSDAMYSEVDGVALVAWPGVRAGPLAA